MEMLIVLEQLTKENIAAVCIRNNLGFTIAVAMIRCAQSHHTPA
jgi:hypothetical protein